LFSGFGFKPFFVAFPHNGHGRQKRCGQWMLTWFFDGNISASADLVLGKLVLQRYICSLV